MKWSRRCWRRGRHVRWARSGRGLMPSVVQTFVAERQQETEEARKLLEEYGAFPLGGIYDCA